MENKYLFAVIGTLILLFGIYAYNYPPVKNKKNVESIQFNTLSSKGTISKPSTLRMSLIEEMVSSYRKNQLISIENAPRNAVKGDSYSILFDLDTLKKFINDIERGVKEIQPTVDTKLAIRMYYAAYPLSAKWNEPGYENLGNLLGKEIPKLYGRKHTLIMIPVIKTNKGIFADFNPFDKNTYQGFPKGMTKGMQLLKDASDTTEIPALNHGQLIPPASTIGEVF
ncbi:MAG: hypothetical protein H7202_12130 [Pedobacter sp.]|nr:hypothetical protein [Pedobacter sp.]